MTNDRTRAASRAFGNNAAALPRRRQDTLIGPINEGVRTTDHQRDISLARIFRFINPGFIEKPLNMRIEQSGKLAATNGPVKPEMDEMIGA